MAIITRPTKIGGNTTYVAEVADGFRIIRASEVDGDFNTIYTAFDGNIDNDNIAAAAAIAYSKLALTGSIVDADISAAANISRTKLAAPAVASGAITDSLTISSTPTTILTLSSLAFTGGYVLLLPGAGLAYHNEYSSIADFTLSVTWLWKRDSTSVAAIEIPIWHDSTQTAVSCTVAAPMYIDTPSSGSYVYSLQVSVGSSPGSQTLLTSTTQPGVGYAVVLR